jgi:hypothetical protein
MPFSPSPYPTCRGGACPRPILYFPPEVTPEGGRGRGAVSVGRCPTLGYITPCGGKDHPAVFKSVPAAQTKRLIGERLRRVRRRQSAAAQARLFYASGEAVPAAQTKRLRRSGACGKRKKQRLIGERLPPHRRTRKTAAMYRAIVLCH